MCFNALGSPLHLSTHFFPFISAIFSVHLVSHPVSSFNFKCWLLPKVIVTYFGIIASKCCHKRIYKYCHYHHCNGMYTNTLEGIEPSNSVKLSLEFPLRSLYTRSQGQKTVGPTLSIFGLQIGPKLLIHSRTMTSGY
jgi:hypothetical protein